MKINWFSPLPPAKTDIGHYTARILPALSRLANICLWTSQEEWAPELERFAEVRQFNPATISWHDLNAADMTFYNIGNNRLFHKAIWEVSQKHPGIVVLHDLHLQDFFHQSFHGQLQDRVAYQQAMSRFYGEAGKSAVEDFWEGRLSMEKLTKDFPLTELALEHALGFVAHTRTATDNFFEKKVLPGCYHPLPYPVCSEPTENLPKSPWRVIMFGYIGPNRRIVEFLEALATCPGREEIQLDIYGELWAPELVQKRISALGLKDQVKIHGFVSEPELGTALSRAHLAVNLRFPTMGEASGSQLRIWDHALPSLVSQVGWYEGLPGDCVNFVRPGYETEDIHQHLSAFMENPEQFKLRGKAGRALLARDHLPASYAEVLVDFAKQVCEKRAVLFSFDLARTLGRECAAWLDVDENAEVYNLLSQKVHGILADY
jgi:glycosyltransferase involved in cell wall biosynthesis